MAIGDALAAPVEFLSVQHIREQFGNHGPKKPSARVTDDTQMALAIGEGLLRAPQPFTPAALEHHLRAALVEWLNSADNDRAPAMACMQACEGLKAGREWQECTVLSSKSSCTNPRAIPVGLLPRDAPDFSERTRACIAQFQAALTSGHPTALAAADLTSTAIVLLTGGLDPADLLQQLLDYAQSQRSIYHQDWLGNLWQLQEVSSAQEFIEIGWDDCMNALGRVEAALIHLPPNADPCDETGEGWLADEALATSLLCFLLHPDNAIAAVRRAAVTGGDSDTIACLTGAFSGAHLGVHAWPGEWLIEIEYRDRLERIANAWNPPVAPRATPEFSDNAIDSPGE